MSPVVTGDSPYVAAATAQGLRAAAGDLTAIMRWTHQLDQFLGSPHLQAAYDPTTMDVLERAHGHDGRGPVNATTEVLSAGWNRRLPPTPLSTRRAATASLFAGRRLR